MMRERFPTIPYSRERLTEAEMIPRAREDVPDEVLRVAIAAAVSAPANDCRVPDIQKKPLSEVMLWQP